MSFRGLLTLVTIFCGSVLWIINHNPYQDKVYTIETQKFDGPKEFELFHREIRTPDDEDRPMYTSGFIVREFEKATQAAEATFKKALVGVGHMFE